jgi:TRAP-type mannitol/chloroaromatic compound transport system permease small subunit
MRAVINIIDSISDWTGKIARWFCVALVLVLVYEVTARYVFTAPTIWAHDMTTMLLCTTVVLGWAYTHRRQGHVRVDVFYMHLSPRRKAIVDVFGALIFLFPLIILLAKTAGSHMMFTWSIGERLLMSYWYPPAGPIRTVVLLGLSLFGLQAISQFTRDLYLLIRNKPYD